MVRLASQPITGRVLRAAAQTDVPPFVEGAYKYTDLAIQWGEQYGIGVWLDYHAANGSQNGCPRLHVPQNFCLYPACLSYFAAQSSPHYVSHYC